MSSIVVKQDFYAKIFVLNLAAILSWVAQAIADRLYKDRKRPLSGELRQRALEDEGQRRAPVPLQFSGAAPDTFSADNGGKR